MKWNLELGLQLLHYWNVYSRVYGACGLSEKKDWTSMVYLIDIYKNNWE
jgi:hypothetical protein